MKLSVATNFDNAFLQRIAAYPVEEIYGKLPRDFVGGGRASYSTGTADKTELESHVACAHSLGIKFSYVLNAVCLGNREWSRRGHQEIRKILDYLSEIKVDSITVSIPYLAELVKKRYPHFSVKVGIFANIDSPTRARFWEDLGANMLVLESFSINRNFPVLKAIRDAVSCDLQLIANFSCLPKCPLQIYHMVGISHGSNTVDREPFMDYCVFKCSSLSMKDPSLLIKSQWIRPEDLSRYEALGYSHFKLLERNAPTEVLLNRVKAYAERISPDNLLELIQPFGFKKEIRKEFGWFWNVFLAKPTLIFPLYKLLKLRGLLYPLRGNPITLDSRKIPADFLDEIAVRPCSVAHDCVGCDYCRSISDDAYRADPKYKQECLKLYQKVFDRLC